MVFPLSLKHSFNRFSTLSANVLQSSASILAQMSKICSIKAVLVLGSPYFFWLLLLIIAHKFSIGFRSGVLGGNQVCQYLHASPIAAKAVLSSHYFDQTKCFTCNPSKKSTCSICISGGWWMTAKNLKPSNNHFYCRTRYSIRFWMDLDHRSFKKVFQSFQ